MLFRAFLLARRPGSYRLTLPLPYGLRANTRTIFQYLECTWSIHFGDKQVQDTYAVHHSRNDPVVNCELIEVLTRTVDAHILDTHSLCTHDR